MQTLKKRKLIFCLFLLIPAVSLYIFSMVYPLVVGTLPNAFYNWNVVKGVHKFNGLDNFTRMPSDETFMGSIEFTLIMAVCSVVIGNIFSFLIAYMLNEKIYAKSVSRSLFFIPNIMSGVLVAYVWLYIFTGAIPEIGNIIGSKTLSEISWFGSKSMARLSVIIVSVWHGAGYLMMLYIAGLQSVPADIIEAATIDGCGPVRKITNIQLPLIMPSITICLFVSISGAFKSFDIGQALTGGGPAHMTQTIAMTIYDTAFSSNKLGYACAQSVVLFLVILLITSVQLAITRKKEVQL